MMMHHLHFLDAALPSPLLEEAAVASAFASDVNAVLDAAGTFAPTLAMLAEFATLAHYVALREAAGRPHDERWRAAYEALDEFLACCPRRAHGGEASRPFLRLSNFLAENADLAPVAAGLRNSEDSN
jgi:hypothetical protein